jgi:hypothetical protein
MNRSKEGETEQKNIAKNKKPLPPPTHHGRVNQRPFIRKETPNLPK